MTPDGRAVNLEAKFAAFDDLWSPKIISQMNDLHIKAVKVEGEFVWHTHAHTDELFLVHKGSLTIELRGHHDVTLGPGELFVVPKGVEHRPIATNECEVLLLEPSDVVNTGDAPEGHRTAAPEWI